ncbi:hypothetical protein M0802_002897 [Mischocyttarus mexicanus]|nr:hypothetical protein M0802_002897 [Mischocyttarus mexicanus]
MREQWNRLLWKGQCGAFAREEETLTNLSSNSMDRRRQDEAPLKASLEAPCEAPLEAPCEAPLEAPCEAPLEAPLETPFEA